jgi:trans-aconitate methyltransferase
MIAEQLQPATFTAHRQREQAFLDTVARYLPPTATALDLGCGDGSSTARFADLVPTATVTGIDLAPANIARAHAQYAGERITFVACDYASSPQAPVNVIIADTVLHLIDMPVLALFRKLSAELTPGGRLIFSAPLACVYNTMLTGVRRCLRGVRHRATDGLLLRVARQLHGSTYDVAFLRERIAYMYIIPQFFLNVRLERTLRECGLRLLAHEPYPHTSLGQMKHAVWVCERC